MTITDTTFSEYDGIAAPAVSAAGKGRVYFDSGDNTFKWSQNAGPYYKFGPVLQTVTSVISANTTTTSATFVTLLTVAITTQASTKLDIKFAGAASSSNNSADQVFFRLTVDGVAQSAVGITTNSSGANLAESMALTWVVTGLAAGAHTVLIQWRRSANTAQIRPVAAPDAESATLTVQEILN
jgi:hypothetical protein